MPKKGPAIDIIIQKVPGDFSEQAFYQIPTNELSEQDEKSIENLAQSYINQGRSYKNERSEIYNLFGWSDSNEYEDSKKKPKFQQFKKKKLVVELKRKLYVIKLHDET